MPQVVPLKALIKQKGGRMVNVQTFRNICETKKLELQLG